MSDSNAREHLDVKHERNREQVHNGHQALGRTPSIRAAGEMGEHNGTQWTKRRAEIAGLEVDQYCRL
ncbi:hypothetical protein [Halalkalicoccus sp. NIPERK01]|uniref:hypothetical protein n=1 Tax=Halalkalicoccus sp. NIPERK01 TaxID=3053469 RepID=UPI00256EEEC4|nr:hypothetical protein [Halalkalicoccus sp. NIPERK01]MDL5360387.1 hypothetical protein [Halalkalicoccus sp. NIPERK01]